MGLFFLEKGRELELELGIEWQTDKMMFVVVIATTAAAAAAAKEEEEIAVFPKEKNGRSSRTVNYTFRFSGCFIFSLSLSLSHCIGVE